MELEELLELEEPFELELELLAESLSPEAVASSVEAVLAEGSVPSIVTLARPPEVLESCTRWPFFSTVTTLASATEMLIDFFTVYSCSHAPVTLSATSCCPSEVISTHEVAPSATETFTTVSWLAAAALEAAARAAASESARCSAAEAVVAAGVVAVLAVTTGTAFFSPAFEAQERIESTRISTRTTASSTPIKSMALRGSELSDWTTPAMPERWGSRRRERSRGSRSAGGAWRRLTLGRSGGWAPRPPWRPALVEEGR